MADKLITAIGFALAAVLAFFLLTIPAGLVAVPVYYLAGKTAFLVASYAIAAAAALYVARQIVLREAL